MFLFVKKKKRRKKKRKSMSNFLIYSGKTNYASIQLTKLHPSHFECWLLLMLFQIKKILPKMPLLEFLNSFSLSTTIM